MSLCLFLATLFTVVELNCENLFDCRHDSLKQDTEFLPDGVRHWTRGRYWNKLEQLSKVLAACGGDSLGGTPPDLIALCEVENDSVMCDLTRRSPLRHLAYDYIMTDSPDRRGIDVALMYHRYTFQPIVHRSIRIAPLADGRPTRDILYVCGQTLGCDTVHVFVVHAPSRYGGELPTRAYRVAVANELCNAVDSIRAVSPQAMIIVAGDFNDGDDGASLTVYESHGLFNATAYATGANGASGTYKYKGQWESIDHIIVGDNMRGNIVGCRIFDEPFTICHDTDYGGVKPRRTYPSFRYDSGGVSDHLPLILRLHL